MAEFIGSKAKDAVRIGLETGPTTTWLWHELRAMGLPVICIDARHAKPALSLRINKSDRNDAFGVARIMQCGWYKEVRALLNSRALLVKMKRDLENQVRGLLKNHGLVIGKAGGKVFQRRAEELAGQQGLLREAVHPLLELRERARRNRLPLDNQGGSRIEKTRSKRSAKAERMSLSGRWRGRDRPILCEAASRPARFQH
jgi:transposase